MRFDEGLTARSHSIATKDYLSDFFTSLIVPLTYTMQLILAVALLHLFTE